VIATLAARPTRAVLLGEDQAPIVVQLREVTLERFVHRLRLQGTIPGPIFGQIRALTRGADLQSAPAMTIPEQPLLKAIARRAVWNTETRQEILSRFLGRAGEESRAADAVALL